MPCARRLLGVAPCGPKQPRVTAHSASCPHWLAIAVTVIIGGAVIVAHSVLVLSLLASAPGADLQAGFGLQLPRARLAPPELGLNGEALQRAFVPLT